MIENDKSRESKESLSTGIGTPIYTSPEIEKGSNYTSKVDMFSLGIIYLEMLLPFSTGMERIKILTETKKTGQLPESFPESYTTERKIIEWLLQLDPEKRPTCRQLLDSNLIPVKMEEEYLRALFTHNTDDHVFSKDFKYERVYQRAQTIAVLTSVFQKHGAVPFDVSVFLPNSSQVTKLRTADKKIVPMMYRSGQLVNMSSDLIPPFARVSIISNFNLPNLVFIEIEI